MVELDLDREEVRLLRLLAGGPADLFRISFEVGAPAVDRLVDRRLVVKNLGVVGLTIRGRGELRRIIDMEAGLMNLTEHEVAILGKVFDGRTWVESRRAAGLEAGGLLSVLEERETERIGRECRVQLTGRGFKLAAELSEARQVMNGLLRLGLGD